MLSAIAEEILLRPLGDAADWEGSFWAEAVRKSEMEIPQ